LRLSRRVGPEQTRRALPKIVIALMNKILSQFAAHGKLLVDSRAGASRMARDTENAEVSCYGGTQFKALHPKSADSRRDQCDVDPRESDRGSRHEANRRRQRAGCRPLTPRRTRDAWHLARHADVEVLTTCATDYVTWRNELPAGVETTNGVSVRRFRVKHERDPRVFGRL
jgi:hypothetical protein